MRKISVFILALILALAFFLRFYKLGEVPYGFSQDESAIGYNAFSIIETGKDEHGESFPLYFKAFGDYKLPIYIYSTIPAIKFFGLTEFAVRFPSALFGFLTVVLFYFFVKALTNNVRLALLGTSLLAINPWHLHYNRITLEVSISLFFFVLGGFLLSKAFQRGKKGLFFLGTLCFIVDIYTYNLTRMLSPVLLLLFLLFYRKKLKAISREEIITTIVISIGFLVPFLTTLFGPGGFGSAGGTLITSSAAVKAPLLEFRSYLIDLPSLFTKLFFNTATLTVWRFLENFASYMSAPFLFVSGSTHGNHGIGNVGQFYLFELPLVVLGIYTIIRDKILWGRLLLLWAIIVILVVSLTREAPQANRSFFLITPLVVFSAVGVFALGNLVKTLKNNKYRTLLIAAFALFAGYNIVYYFASYYVRFPVAYAKSWRSADKDISLYLGQVSSSYDKVIFDKKAGFVYTSLLFYQQIPPKEFQETAVYEPDDSEGMSPLASFGKYEFRNIDWDKDGKSKNTLIITSLEGKPEDKSVKAIFSYPKRPVVISTRQEILQFPVEDVAYVVIETE